MKNTILFTVLILSTFIANCQIGAINTKNGNQPTVLNLDTYFNTLNLQSNTNSNFTIEAPNKVSQWNDLSSNANHAVQATTGLKPLFYDNGIDGVTWDRVNDVLTLGSEISLTDFTLFIVFKDKANPVTNAALVGANSENNGIVYGNSYLTIITNSNTEVGTYQLGQTNMYKLLMVRRSGSTLTVSINDRQLTLANITQTIGTSALKIKTIGWIANTSTECDGAISAVCVHNTALDDATVFQLKTAFYRRYSIIFNSLITLIGFGDSITQWFGIPNSVGTLLGIPAVNNGFQGTTASNVDPAHTYSGQDRWSATCVTRPYKDYIYVFFGANDITISLISSTDYQNGLTAIISGLIAAGYNSRNILVCSAPYRKDYLSVKTKADAIVAVAQSVATTYNTRYVNMLQPFVDTGVPDTYFSDNLHPNAAGQTLMINLIFNAFLGN